MCLLIAMVGVGGCDGAQEPARVDLPVVVDSSGLRVTDTDLGYAVRLEQVDTVLTDVGFSVAGEIVVDPGTHGLGVIERAWRLLVPEAHAHPGHYTGGEVTGELLGRFAVRWQQDDGRVLGLASLLAGRYTNASLGLGPTAIDPQTDEPEHAARLLGTAERAGAQWAFQIVMDTTSAFVVDGIAFDRTVDESTTGSIRLGLVWTEEGAGLLDGVDFALLDTDGDGEVLLATDATDLAERTAAQRVLARLESHGRYALASP